MCRYDIYENLWSFPPKHLVFTCCSCVPILGEVGKGICYGDSGGPLVVRNGNTDILVGVTSMLGDKECSKVHKYDNIFARTSGAMDWIKSVVCSEWGEQADFCAKFTNQAGVCTDAAGWLDP